jgi:pentatricopeptide repeat protein
LLIHTRGIVRIIEARDRCLMKCLIKNGVSWTAMISGCTQLGEIANAISLFKKMPDSDVPAWNAVVSISVHSKQFVL